MKFFPIIIFAICLGACAKDTAPADQVIQLDPDQTEGVNASSFIKNVTFLKLSSEDNAYIGNIEKVHITEDRIYVLDARSTVALFVYDRTGDLLFKIANYGRGPGEFMGPYDFNVDEKEEKIIIFDARALKLSYYKIEDGEFIEDKHLDFYFGRFAVTEDNYIFFLNNMALKYQHNIIITDKELNVVEKKMEMNPNMIGYHFSLPVNFSTYGQNYFLTVPSDYNIYQFNETENTFGVSLKIDFDEKALPETFYQKHPDNRSRRDETGESAYHISNYFVSERFTFFRYLYKKNDQGYNNFFFESKMTNQVIHSEHGDIKDDIGVGPLIGWPNAIYKSTLVWYQQPIRLLNYINNKKETLTEGEWVKFRNEKKELLEFATSISEEDNPYLIFTEIDF